MKKILVIGSMNMDFVFNVEAMPIKGETIISEKLELIPGGKGANQAYTIGKLSGNVAMLGAVGKDEYGKRLMDNLSSVGVDVSHIRVIEESHTGNAFISVDKNGDNSIVVVQGANKCVDKEYIDENIDLIRDSEIVVFQLEIPIDTVVYAAKRAKEFGKFIILDPAPARDDLPPELFNCVDIIKPNEVELSTLVGDEKAGEHLGISAQKLADKGVDTVVVTLGGDGAYLFGKDLDRRFQANKEIKVVDTTAAGDSFTAAMALSLAKGKSISESIDFAIKVAEIVVTRKGAQISIPTIEEIAQ